MNNFPVRVLKGKEAREKLMAGIDIVAYAVGSTLGPTGRNVALNKPVGAPDVIHDGVNTAKRIELEDEFEDMGAKLIKEAALQTSKKAGDGTTTSTVLAQAIIKRGFDMISDDSKAVIVKKQIEEASKKLISELKKLAKPVKDLESIKKVATISAADGQMGSLVAEVVHKVGAEGIVQVEESRTTETYVQYRQGFEFDRGFYSQSFVTDEEKMEVVINNPYILLTDIKINHDHQIVPFLEMAMSKGIKDVVIVGEVQEEALSILIINTKLGKINAVAVQAPSWGDMRMQELEDIAVLTGGTVILNDSGRDLKSVLPEELGRAGKFIADADKSKIIDGKGGEVAIKGRIKELTESIKHTSTPYNKDQRRQRLARLSGTAAIIYVGASSDPELSDRKEKIDDAVRASQAALEEGIVAGGEITLLYLSYHLKWGTDLGSTILKEAIREPFKKLMSNAGMDYTEVWSKISPLEYPFGIDVMDGEKKDMIESGIIDPVKVTRLVVENAVSVAGMVLITEVIISEPYQKIKSK